MIKYYYPRTTRAITIALLDMFNDITVVKYDKDGIPISERTVDVTFGPVEKYHQDRIEDHYFDANGVENNNRYYLRLPRIAITFNGIAHDPDRVTGANEWRYWFKETLGISEREMDNVMSDYQPTPYNYNFTVFIKNDSMDYLSQILENILPYFNPALMLRVKEFSFLNIERDLPVTIDGVNPEFVDDQNDTDTRYVNATMSLTVRGFMYRPLVYSKIIKYIDSNYINKSTGLIINTYNTSGVETSGGEPIITSAVPEEFWTSGHYGVSGLDGKEYNYYKNYWGYGLD